MIIADQSRSMCCPGCAAAARLIGDAGLSDYYRYRDEPAPKADTAVPGEYSAYDIDEIQREFVQRETDGTRRALLSIDGMGCAACVWLLEHYLSRLDGVGKVSARLDEQRLNIEFDERLATLSNLMVRIKSLGYRPRPFRVSDRTDAARTESRRYLLRLGVSGLVMMQLGMFAIGLYAGAFQGISDDYRNILRWASLVLAIPVVGFAATPFFSAAWRGLRVGHTGMDLPVSLAIGIAFIASCTNTMRGSGEVYFDSLAMFTFFLLLARFLELRSRQHAGFTASGLLGQLPDVATRLGTSGDPEQVPLGAVRAGDRLLVRVGETFPADGHVLKGQGGVDESTLTGESLPVHRGPGDAISAGTLNVDGVLEIEVDATGLESRLGNILQLLDRAEEEKPALAALADRLAGQFVFGVLLVATGTAIYWTNAGVAEMLPATLAVLIVSCPCALSLATPVALTAATNRLRRHGFLITRGHALEALAQVNLAYFDKTGTLTSGEFRLLETRATDAMDPMRAVKIAATLESRSEHPLASAFAGVPGPMLQLEELHVVAGQGVEGIIEGRCYRIGRPAWVSELSGQLTPSVPEAGRWILLGNIMGAQAWFRIGDRLRPCAPTALEKLQGLGIAIGVLSGDQETEVRRVTDQLDLVDVRGDLTASDKLAAIRSLQDSGQRVLAVGDGVNDLLVLAGADVSVAVTNAADISMAQADCILLSPELGQIADAITVARKTRHVIRQNLAWAILYNLLAIPFAAAGLVPPWLAAIGMSSSSLLVVGNARRLQH